MSGYYRDIKGSLGIVYIPEGCIATPTSDRDAGVFIDTGSGEILREYRYGCTWVSLTFHFERLGRKNYQDFFENL